MSYLGLPMSEPSMEPTVRPQLCLNTAGCDTNCMIIWLLHHMWHHDTDYAMMPLSLWPSFKVPWELCMEEYLKLWQNSTYITWKASFPCKEVSIAMTFVSTSHRELDSHQLVIDISDRMAIQYPASKVDNKDGDGDESMGNVVEEDDDDDSEDEEDLDEDLQRMATEIANKTDDSSFCSSAEDNPKIEVLMGTETTWTGKVPSYSLGAPVMGTSILHSSHTVSRSGKMSEASFDAYVNAIADGSGVAELMGGEALLWECTTVAELKQLRELANEQIQIVHHFDAKFSNMAFTLLQKRQEAFVGTGGIMKKFVDDMATAGLNFIRDATVYEAELSALDSVAFAAGLASIWERIAELMREASELKLTYEGAQKQFASILEKVGKDMKEYLDTQSMADCTTFMDESFKNLCKFSDAFNVSPFIPVVVVTAITHHSLLTSLWVNMSHILLKIFLSPLTSDATAALGQMVLLSYIAQQGIAIWERQAWSKQIPGVGTRIVDPTLKSDHGSNASLAQPKPMLGMMGLTPSKKD